MITIQPITPHRKHPGTQPIHISYGKATSPFGTLFCAQTDIGISSLEFEHDQLSYDLWLIQLKRLHPQAIFIENTKKNQETAQRVMQLISSQTSQQISVTLNINASPFQIEVWQALLEIEPGQLCSYQQVAGKIGKPKASRAVGSAVARNPVAILIPCHRVIKSNGDFGQYRWGSDRKQAIHAWECAGLPQANNQIINGS